MERMKIKLTIPDSVSVKLNGMVSRGISALEVNEQGHLIVTLTDNTTHDLGKVSGNDGADGEDGVSVTHEWDGTVLRVTSASGTSEADLKGENGEPGEDGYTPQKGVDYFDGNDGKSAFQSAVDGGYDGTEEDFNKSLADVPVHIEDDVRHISEDERRAWNESTNREISWDELEGKPVKPVFHTYFEWSEGYVPEDWVGQDEMRGFYKVSNTPLSREELVGCVVEYTTGDGVIGEVIVTEELINEDKNGEVLVVDLNDYVNIFMGMPICSVETSFDLGMLDMVLSRGLWVAYDDPGVGDTIRKIYKAGEVLDDAYLPPIKAEEFKFAKDLITTYEIGSINLEKGQAVIPAEGKTLQEVWDTIFVTELPPTVEEPKVTLGAQKFKAYEVGERVETTYNVELSAGKYSYGPDTGITASAWSVKDTLGVELTSSVGAFSTLVVRDKTSYSITARATHGAGAIPFTNLGNEYPEGQIAAGEKSATSAAITGYRNGFYGTAADKEAAIDSSFVRSLANKSGKTPAAGNVWNLAIPVGAMRIVFAYPATIRDVSSVLDVNGLNAEIKSAFTKYTVSVEGANGYEGIDYKVYVLDRAAATTEANTFKITI